MSAVFYNGVTLPYPMTTSFRTTALYDDESRTDWWGIQYDFAWTFLVNMEYLGALSIKQAGLTQSPAGIMKYIQQLLLQPRAAFTYRFNGVDLIPEATAGPGTVDIANGPLPQYCEYSAVTENMFFMSYGLRATYWVNNTAPSALNGLPNNQQGNQVLFNRWSETVDIDSCNYSTRTREGKYRIRSDNQDGFIADRYRERMAVVGKPDGFVRKSSRYTVSPDGLAISYSVTDVETYKTYPLGVYEADGHYLETATKHGAMLHGEAVVHFRGSKKQGVENSQGWLIGLAIAVAASKLQISGANLQVNLPPGGAPKSGILEYFSLTVDLYQNDVRVHMRAMFPRAKRRVNGAAVARGQLFNWPVTPGSDPVAAGGAEKGWRPNLDIRGNEAAFKLLQAAAYYDPSIQNVRVNTAIDQMSAGLVPGEAGKAREPRLGDP